MTLKTLKALKEYLFPREQQRFVREAPLFDALTEEIEMVTSDMEDLGDAVLKPICICTPFYKTSEAGVHLPSCPLAKKEEKPVRKASWDSHNNCADCKGEIFHYEDTPNGYVSLSKSSQKEDVKKPTWEICRRLVDAGIEVSDKWMQKTIDEGWEPFAVSAEMIYFRRLKT
jgi:hypothetical protein